MTTVMIFIITYPTENVKGYLLTVIVKVVNNYSPLLW